MLREHFDMRYKKIKRIDYQGNSDRNLVLRSLYAKALFTALNENKIIINIDETWISETDFRSRKWCIRN